MKIALILSVPLLVLSSCNTGADEEKTRTEAMNELTSFVDSVSTQVATTAEVNWDQIDARYDRLENNADEAFKNSSDEVKADLNNVEERYDQLKDDYQTKEKNLIEWLMSV